MKTFLLELKTSVLLTLGFAVLLGGAYPLAVWAAAQALFPARANGSLVVDRHGVVRGSRLLAQAFTGDRYFHPRPSAVGYDAANSGSSNLGPTSQALADRIRAALAAYRTENGLAADAAVPADAVTCSGSGLDPDISPANATLQAARVARARRLPPTRVAALIAAHTTGPTFGFLGEPRVNVLELNLALDAAALR